MPDASARRDFAFLALLTAALLAGVYALHGRNLIGPHDDDWDYLHQARQLLRGEGFSSLWTHPVNLTVEPDAVARFHNLWKPPAMALLLWPVVALAGERPPLVCAFAVMWLSMLGLVWATYALARQLAGRTAALWAAALVAANGRLLLLTPRVLSEVPFAFLFTLALITLVAARTPARAALAGAAFGAALLMRTNTLFFLPGAVMFLLLRHGRAGTRHILSFTGAALALGAPWWVRTALITGDPLYNTSMLLPMMFTPTYPGWTLFQGLERPALGAFARQHGAELSAKYAAFLVYYLTRLPLLAGAITPLGLWLVLDHSAPPSQRRLGAAVLIMLVTQLLLVSLYEEFLRVFYNFIPALLVLAFCAGDRLVMRYGPRLRLAVTALAALCALESGVRIIRAPRAAVPDLEAWCRAVAAANPGSVVATDVPGAVAWYGDTRALLIPRHLDTLRTIDATLVPIGAGLVALDGDRWIDDDMFAWLVEAEPGRWGVALAPPETPALAQRADVQALARRVQTSAQQAFPGGMP